MNKPSVGAVLLNFNNTEETLICVDELKACPGADLTIYIIDNGSRPEHVKQLKQLSSESMVKIIWEPKNLGFGGGCRVGIEQAKADGMEHIWLLNNDTLLEKDTITSHLEAVNSHPPGLWGCQILYAGTDLAWYDGGFLKHGAIPEHRNEFEPLKSDGSVEEVDWITGCSLWAPRSVWESGIAIYEPYFLYVEDVDLCLQARAKGIPRYHLNKALVHHKVSTTNSRISWLVEYYNIRNSLFCSARHELWSWHQHVLDQLWEVVLREVMTADGWKSLFRMFKNSDYDPKRMAHSMGWLDYRLKRMGQRRYGFMK